jgi:hypothetical protein
MNVSILGVKRKNEYKEIMIMVSEDGRSQIFGSGCFFHSIRLKFRKQGLMLGKVDRTGNVREV